MEQGIEGKMIELFGKEYLTSDQDILTNESTNYNSTEFENENETFCRINSVFSLKDESSKKWNSNYLYDIPEKITNNESYTNLKKIRELLRLKKKILSVVDPDNDIFKNTILNDMVLYFLNDNFLFNYDCLWNTAECELIKELVIKLIDTLNNTKNNIVYLSSCFMNVFCKMANNIEPNELTRAFILFINALKKYVKYIDNELWKKWFLSNNFVSWCYVLHSLFKTGDNELAIILEKSVINEANEYFKKAKHSKYQIKNVSTVKSGIFELTSSDDVLDKILFSTNTETVSKNTTNVSPNEPISPQISVCSEFNVTNSFKTDMINRLLLTSKTGHNNHTAAVDATKSSNIDENECSGFSVKKMHVQQEKHDVRSEQQPIHNLDVSSHPVQDTLADNSCSINVATNTQPMNKEPTSFNIIQDLLKTTIIVNSPSQGTVKSQSLNDKINKQTKQHSTKVMRNKTSAPNSITNPPLTYKNTQIIASEQNQLKVSVKTKHPTVNKCRPSKVNKNNQIKQNLKNVSCENTITPTTVINLPQNSKNTQISTKTQNHLPIAKNTWPPTMEQNLSSNVNMNKQETQFSTNTMCNKTIAPSSLIKPLSTSLKKQNRTCAPSPWNNTAANCYSLPNNEQCQASNINTNIQNNQCVTNQGCNNNNGPSFNEQSRTSTFTNTWSRTCAQSCPSNVNTHWQNNQFVTNQVHNNSGPPINKQNPTLISTNNLHPSNAQSQPLYDNMIMETNEFEINPICNNKRSLINKKNLTLISTKNRHPKSRPSNDNIIIPTNNFKTNQMSDNIRPPINEHLPSIPNDVQSSIRGQILHSNNMNKNYPTGTNSSLFNILNSSSQTNNQYQPPCAINAQRPSSMDILPSANITWTNQYDASINNNPSIVNNINLTLQSNTINAKLSNNDWSNSFYAASYNQSSTHYSHQNTYNPLNQRLCSNTTNYTTSSSGYLPPTPSHGVIPNTNPSKSTSINSLPYQNIEKHSSAINMVNSYEPPDHNALVIIVYF